MTGPRKCPKCGLYMASYIIPTYCGGTVNYHCSCGYQSIKEPYTVSSRSQYTNDNNTSITKPNYEIMSNNGNKFLNRR